MATYGPNPTLYVLMLDASGIQHYIFGSNQLKENIGASFIVSHLLYHKLLIELLEERFSGKFLVEWEEAGELQMDQQDQLRGEIAFIGGGSAMVLFRRESDLQSIARDFSESVLLHFPGIRLTIGHAETTAHELRHEMGKVRGRVGKTMERSKQDHFVRTTLPKPGIVEDGASTGFAAETCKDKAWVSQVSVTKKAVAEAANRRLQAELLRFSEGRTDLATDQKQRASEPGYTAENFDFPLELDKMGQPSDKGYIAVIHLDGNGIGKRFQDCQSLGELRKLSLIVRDTGNEALYLLVMELRLKLERGGSLNKTYKLQKNKDGDRYLPLRPLFVGGDDIVLICEGRLGMWVAERYIEIYCAEMNRKLGVSGGDPDRIVACAGVAIVKTKYPFFRAYQLGEELMRSSKKVSRTAHDSWIDFLVSSTGFNGELGDVRDDHYHLGNDALFHGPYCLSKDPKGIHLLKAGIKDFRDSKKWPRNKVMELRDVLMQDAAAVDYFKATLGFRKLQLPAPDAPSRLHHLDMIQLKDFYPQPLLP